MTSAARVARITRTRCAKLTRTVGGVVQFSEAPPLLLRIEHTDLGMADVVAVVDSYRQSLSDDCRELFDRFEVVDVARKVVGVGSVGTWCWIALLEGPHHPEGDRLVFQVKEAQPSVLAPYAGESKYEHQGQRVVVGQRLTQAASDRFLGWAGAPGSGRQYYIRQLWDAKGSGDPMAMDYRNLCYYGALCAGTLARAHARTGDAVQISSYLGTSDRFDLAMAAFAAAYAQANERDHASLLQAIADGRIEASTD